MPAPSYRITIVKSYLGKQWSNDYLTIDANIAGAANEAVLLLEFERRLHLTVVTFDYWRVSTMTVGDRVFRHVPVNALGLRAAGTEPMPLYCTARLDMPTTDSDPARKYFRLPVQEGEQSAGTLLPASVAALQAIVQTYLITAGALAPIVTPKGHTVTGAVMSNVVQMRQLLRKKRSLGGVVAG